ncbi:MAG: hypothetical protein ABSE54_02185 [Smithella sp.]|jgi:hypothetical protein
MAEKIQIVIEPPESHPDFLTIKDAMEQVLDYFQLTVIGEPDTENIAWKLVSISMKSPLTVTAEAYSFDQTINIDEVAKKQKDRLTNGIKSVLKGITPKEWTSEEAGKIINRVLKRNNNGIGKTSIIVDFEKDSLPIEITPQLAISAVCEIDKSPSHFFTEDLSRKELGSVDGYLIAVGYDYGKPAIEIQDRLTEERIWCRVPDETINSIAKEMQLDDIWKHRRVIVRGLIQYEKAGRIKRIFDTQVEPMVSKEIPLDKIHDSMFTQGMSPSEYLKKLREGNLD